MQSQRSQVPIPILLEAAQQFSDWVKQNAQGAEVILCGGLAFVQYGSQRVTQDADLCMDLSRTQRSSRSGAPIPFDTNALKDIASRDSRLIVGPKIYWVHQPTRIPVQVDFVDANLFWRPFDIRAMVDTTPTGTVGGVPSLNPPTLLVGKMKSALERSDQTKQSKDVWDFDFAMTLCFQRRSPLTVRHLEHLAADLQGVCHVVHEFAKLRLSLMGKQLDQNGSMWVNAWASLIKNSGLHRSLIDAARVNQAQTTAPVA
ncbi:hypothetical protein DENSPDRAFT_885967 [Dentipellis sp. KUC8613]|nr:hypothetical protein DENSPDRAFT_885967 [Dentipellis sp. KUC8613]